MAIKQLRIGTRGSELALIQSRLVADALTGAHPALKPDFEIIKTQGDRNLNPIPLDTVGKAWFTAEIDQALLDRRIDLAVHSLKDLPLDLPANLALTITLPRADPRDALLSRSGAKLHELPPGAVVGTDSSRRRAQLLHFRPDLHIRSLRGNVQTRLRKLQAGDYDAIVLAAAGLVRLGDDRRITELLDPTHFIPAAGQGALGVESRPDNPELLTALHQLGDPDTIRCVAAERAFTAAVGGGCQLPVGCYVSVADGTASIHAMLAALDGPEILYDSTSGPAASAPALAETLARSMLDHCPFKFEVAHGAR